MITTDQSLEAKKIIVQYEEQEYYKRNGNERE